MSQHGDAALSDVVAVAGSVPGAGVPAFDARSIPEYNGSTSITEWWEQAALLCDLRGVSLMAVLPTRLRVGAFAVWSRMPAATRHDLNAVKAKLFKAFALDPFAAYDAISPRRPRHGEAADVYLADLQQHAELMGGLSEAAVAIIFVHGLPDAVQAAVRDSLDGSLDLERVLDRARSVLSRAATAEAAAATFAAAAARPTPAGQPRPRPRARCWTCGAIGHLAAACPRRQEPSGASGNAAGDD